MKKTAHNLLAVIAVTAAAAVLVLAANTSNPFPNPRFFDFPLVIDDWKGRDIAMDDYVYQLMETEYLFLRDYHSPRRQAPVNLSIVWFDYTDIAFHAPEACLGGVGHKVKEKTIFTAEINGTPQTLGRLVVEQAHGRRSLVLYYFDVDGHWTLSQADIRLQILGKRLLFKRASASFIRLMAPITTTEQEAADAILDFLQAAMGRMPMHLYTEHVR